MKSYKDIRKELASEAAEVALMPCETCKTPTRVQTLNILGARCGPCFSAYCRAAFNGREARVSREEAARRLAAFVGSPE